MKSVLFTIAFACTLSAAIAQPATQIVHPGNFTGVRCSSPINLKIVPGDTCSVMVKGGDNDASKLTVNDGILVIDPSFVDNVIVTMPRLNTLYLSGSCDAKTAGAMTTDTLRVEVNGASSADIDVKASKVNASLDGASDLKIAGTTGELDATVAGASDLKAYSLSADNVQVNADGASDAYVTANQILTVQSSGASDVRYRGNPAQKNITGSADSTVDGSNAKDTTSFVLGGHKLRIVDEGKVDERSDREKKASNDDFKFWRGFDLGVSGYLTSDNKLPMPQGLSYLDLNYTKSYLFSWNMFEKNIHIYRNNVNLCTGLGLSWYHYNFRNPYTLQPNVDFEYSVPDSLNFSKNRLNVCYVNVPLLLEYNSNNDDARNSFHLGGGMQFGYNVFHNKLKQKYEEDGHTYKRLVKNDFNVNPFRIDAMIRIGYGNFTLFGAYSLSSLFAENKGPAVYPFTAGIHIKM